MGTDRSRLRVVMAALLVLTSVLLVVGVFIERGAVGAAPAPAAATAEGATRTAAPAPADAEGGEGSVAHEAAEGAAATAAPDGEGTAAHEAAEHQGSSEAASDALLAGLDLEATPVLLLAVGLSALLALGVWRSRGVAIVGLAMAVAALLAVLDLRELGHQWSEGRGALAALAGVVALGHLAVVALGAWLIAAVRRDRLAS